MTDEPEEQSEEDLFKKMSRNLFAPKPKSGTVVEVRRRSTGKLKGRIIVEPERIPLNRGGDHEWLYKFYAVHPHRRIFLKSVAGIEDTRAAIKEYRDEGREVSVMEPTNDPRDV